MTEIKLGRDQGNIAIMDTINDLVEFLINYEYNSPNRATVTRPLQINETEVQITSKTFAGYLLKANDLLCKEKASLPFGPMMGQKDVSLLETLDFTRDNKKHWEDLVEEMQDKFGSPF